MKKKKNKVFKSDNFYLASYLIAEGQELYGLEPVATNSSKFFFCFFNTEDLQELVKKFFSFRAVVKPQTYAAAERHLRGFIHQKYKDGVKNNSTSA